MNQSKPLSLNTHDFKVLGFQLLLAAIQGVLMQLKVENFGIYQPYIVMGINLAGELARRYISG